MAEAAIRQRVADGVEAVRAKDIDAVMALYASNIVSFDIGPPLRYSGADNKRRAWPTTSSPAVPGLARS